ncbi:hypothetical protein CPB85DRAFT_1268931 [Mucidula mucida]|nr:hypothetical protein CPB85DRAFT_1268931 [Mucidula mucida]
MSDSVRSEIYILTALLQDEQRRRPAGTFNSIKDRGVFNTPQTTAGTTFQHLATILTRGSQDEKDRIVAVTAGPLNENPLRLYLTTRSPSAPTISPSSSNEINDTELVVPHLNDEIFPHTIHISHEPVPSENDEPLLNISAPVVREGTLPTVVSLRDRPSNTNSRR